MLKKITLLIMAVFLVSFASASLGTFKLNDCVNIQTILDTTEVTISTILYPNSTIAEFNKSMTQDNGLTWNYTFCKANALGNYIYDYYDADGSVYVNDFDITATGYYPSQEELYILIVGLIFLVLLIFGCYYIITTLPSADAQDADGTILQVNQLKHLRNVLWVVIWGLSLGIIFIISNISLAYLHSALLGDFFFMIYKIMFWMTIIGVPMYFIWIFYKVMTDREVQRMIERGVEMKGTP